MSLGTFATGSTVVCLFNTRDAGVPTTLVGGAVAVYKNASTTQTTIGVTLTTDFDGVTGLHQITIDTSASVYTAGAVYTVLLTAGTVGGFSAAGLTIDDFSLEQSPTLTPTVGGPAQDAVAALDLITDAFAELNCFLPGESIPATDAQFGRRSLNGLLGQWAQQHLTIPTTARLSFTLVAGHGSPAHPYTIGPGGDFDTPRPANADALRGAALLITASAFEMPLEVWTASDWQTLLTKTESGTQPIAVWYDPTFTAGFGALYVWPQPSDVTNPLVLYIDAPLSTFADLTTAYQLPPGYRDCLVFGLAKRLATPYGKEVTPELREKAASALSLIKRSNVRPENMTPWSPGGTWYDINSDQVFTR
jgi:hypothetical protein